MQQKRSLEHSARSLCLEHRHAGNTECRTAASAVTPLLQPAGHTRRNPDVSHRLSFLPACACFDSLHFYTPTCLSLCCFCDGSEETLVTHRVVSLCTSAHFKRHAFSVWPATCVFHCLRPFRRVCVCMRVYACVCVCVFCMYSFTGLSSRPAGCLRARQRPKGGDQHRLH